MSQKSIYRYCQEGRVLVRETVEVKWGGYFSTSDKGGTDLYRTEQSCVSCTVPLWRSEESRRILKFSGPSKTKSGESSVNGVRYLTEGTISLYTISVCTGPSRTDKVGRVYSVFCTLVSVTSKTAGQFDGVTVTHRISNRQEKLGIETNVLTATYLSTKFGYPKPH